jgi:hypothetical protein
LVTVVLLKVAAGPFSLSQQQALTVLEQRDLGGQMAALAHHDRA